MWIHFLLDGAGGVVWNDFASFGAAGMMGAMWLWERRTSQKREEQLDDAHTRILGDRIQLEQLISVVRENSQALSRLTTTHEQLVRQLEANHNEGRTT